MIERILIQIIVFYQKTFSQDKGFVFKMLGKTKSVCVFYPTCSNYAIIAIKKYGVVSGLFLSIKRVLRCHPWQKPSVDMP